MSTSEPLELEQFEQLLSAHGATLERWPAELGAAARRLLDSSEPARERWSEARRFEALLDAAPAIEPSSALIARIATLPARHPQSSSFAWWPFGNPFSPLLAWGAAVSLGLLVGMAVPELDAEGASVAEPSEDAAQSEDLRELSELAFGGQWSLEEE
jgi:hypothetical protein